MSVVARSSLSKSLRRQRVLAASNPCVSSLVSTRNTLLASHNQQQTPLMGVTIHSFSTTSSGTTDFFELFGLPRKFGIHQPELKGTYLKLMTEHHPDKAAQQLPQESETDITAEIITHAYQTLQAPHTRASHWLDLHSVGIEDGSEAPILSMEFLMEIMEWRERIEELSHMEDEKQLQDLLKEISEETAHLQSECESALGDLLDTDADLGDDDVLQRARQLTAQLQYWHRLEETLKDATDVV